MIFAAGITDFEEEIQMKKKLLNVLMGITALALILCQYACSSSTAKTANYVREDTPSSYGDGESYLPAETAAGYEDEYRESPDYSAAKANSWQGNSSPDETGSDPGKDIPAATLEEKLVYTCTMDMETTQYDETIRSLRELIQKYGGIIQHESYSDSASNWYYSSYEKKSGTMSAAIIVRIPSAKYRDFLDGIDGFGKITRSEQSVENITRRYSETETTIRSLETQEERLLEMMAQAETVDEMLSIEYRLSEVQNELQILKNRLAEMDTDVAYSTVQLNVREVLEFTPEVEPTKTLTFGDRLRNALRNSWNTFRGFLEGLLFFLIEAGPILLVVGGISVGIMLIIMKSVKRAKRKNAEKAR